jgi:hypothetical protein
VAVAGRPDAAVSVVLITPKSSAYPPKAAHVRAAHAAHTPQAQPEEGTLAGSAGWRKPKTPQSTSEHLRAPPPA